VIPYWLVTIVLYVIEIHRFSSHLSLCFQMLVGYTGGVHSEHLPRSSVTVPCLAELETTPARLVIELGFFLCVPSFKPVKHLIAVPANRAIGQFARARECPLVHELVDQAMTAIKIVLNGSGFYPAVFEWVI